MCNSGGSSSSTTTIPPEILQAYQGVASAAGNFYNNTKAQNYSEDPNAFVAGLSPTQEAGIKNINAAAGQAQPYFNMATSQLAQGQQAANQQQYAGMANMCQAYQNAQGYNQAATGDVMNGQQVGRQLNQMALNTACNAYSGTQPYNQQAGGFYNQAYCSGSPYIQQASSLIGSSVAPVCAQQIGGKQINQFMSPYTNTVLQGTQGMLNQQNQQAMSGQLGNAISSGAYGGCRSGLAAANLAQQQRLADAQTYSGILNQGYGQALGAAQQQQGVNLGAAQANRAAQQQGVGQLLGIGQQAYSQAACTGKNLQGLGQQVYGQGMGLSQQQANIGQQQYAQCMGAANQMLGIGNQGYNQGMGLGQAKVNFGQQLYGQGMGNSQQYANLGTGAQNASLQGAQAQMQAGQAQQQVCQAKKTAMFNQFMQTNYGIPQELLNTYASAIEGIGKNAGSTTSGTQNKGLSCMISIATGGRVNRDAGGRIGKCYGGGACCGYGCYGGGQGGNSNCYGGGCAAPPVQADQGVVYNPSNPYEGQCYGASTFTPAAPTDYTSPLAPQMENNGAAAPTSQTPALAAATTAAPAQQQQGYPQYQQQQGYPQYQRQTAMAGGMGGAPQASGKGPQGGSQSAASQPSGYGSSMNNYAGYGGQQQAPRASGKGPQGGGQQQQAYGQQQQPYGQQQQTYGQQQQSMQQFGGAPQASGKGPQGGGSAGSMGGYGQQQAGPMFAQQCGSVYSAPKQQTGPMFAQQCGSAYGNPQQQAPQATGKGPQGGGQQQSGPQPQYASGGAVNSMGGAVSPLNMGQGFADGGMPFGGYDPNAMAQMLSAQQGMFSGAGPAKHAIRAPSGLGTLKGGPPETSKDNLSMPDQSSHNAIEGAINKQINKAQTDFTDKAWKNYVQPKIQAGMDKLGLGPPKITAPDTSGLGGASSAGIAAPEAAAGTAGLGAAADAGAGAAAADAGAGAAGAGAAGAGAAGAEGAGAAAAGAADAGLAAAADTAAAAAATAAAAPAAAAAAAAAPAAAATAAAAPEAAAALLAFMSTGGAIGRRRRRNRASGGGLGMLNGDIGMPDEDEESLNPILGYSDLDPGSMSSILKKPSPRLPIEDSSPISDSEGLGAISSPEPSIRTNGGFSNALSALPQGEAPNPASPAKGGKPSGLASILSLIGKAEGTGKNPLSTAIGPYQIVDKTFVNGFRKMFPERAQSMRDDHIIALRSTPEGSKLSEKMAPMLAQEGVDALKQNSLPVTPGNIYLTWFLGPHYAVKTLQSKPSASMDDILPQSFIDANKTVLAGKTAAQLANWTADRLEAQRAKRNSSGLAAAAPQVYAAGGMVRQGYDFGGFPKDPTDGLFEAAYKPDESGKTIASKELADLSSRPMAVGPPDDSELDLDKIAAELKDRKDAELQAKVDAELKAKNDAESKGFQMAARAPGPSSDSATKPQTFETAVNKKPNSTVMPAPPASTAKVDSAANPQGLGALNNPTPTPVPQAAASQVDPAAAAAISQAKQDQKQDDNSIIGSVEKFGSNMKQGLVTGLKGYGAGLAAGNEKQWMPLLSGLLGAGIGAGSGYGGLGNALGFGAASGLNTYQKQMEFGQKEEEIGNTRSAVNVRAAEARNAAFNALSNVYRNNYSQYLGGGQAMNAATGQREGPVAQAIRRSALMNGNREIMSDMSGSNAGAPDISMMNAPISELISRFGLPPDLNLNDPAVADELKRLGISPKAAASAVIPLPSQGTGEKVSATPTAQGAVEKPAINPTNQYSTSKPVLERALGGEFSFKPPQAPTGEGLDPDYNPEALYQKANTMVAAYPDEQTRLQAQQLRDKADKIVTGTNPNAVAMRRDENGNLIPDTRYADYAQNVLPRYKAKQETQQQIHNSNEEAVSGILDPSSGYNRDAQIIKSLIDVYKMNDFNRDSPQYADWIGHVLSLPYIKALVPDAVRAWQGGGDEALKQSTALGVEQVMANGLTKAPGASLAVMQRTQPVPTMNADARYELIKESLANLSRKYAWANDWTKVKDKVDDANAWQQAWDKANPRAAYEKDAIRQIGGFFKGMSKEAMSEYNSSGAVPTTPPDGDIQNLNGRKLRYDAKSGKYKVIG